MSFLWMIVAGLVIGLIAKVPMRQRDPGGLLALGIGGSMIAGTIQYSLHQPVGLPAPVIGAVLLLTVYGLIPAPKPREARGLQREGLKKEQTIDHSEDFRKAA